MSEFRVATQNNNFRRRKLDNGTFVDGRDEELSFGSHIDGNILEDIYVAWITACGVPFEIVEREEFRAYVELAR